MQVVGTIAVLHLFGMFKSAPNGEPHDCSSAPCDDSYETGAIKDVLLYGQCLRKSHFFCHQSVKAISMQPYPATGHFSVFFFSQTQMQNKNEDGYEDWWSPLPFQSFNMSVLLVLQFTYSDCIIISFVSTKQRSSLRLSPNERSFKCTDSNVCLDVC